MIADDEANAIYNPLPITMHHEWTIKALPQTGHSITVNIGGNSTVETRDRRASYGYQLDAFIAAVEHGKPLFTDAADGVNQMFAIERCYDAVGLAPRGLDL